jgi:enoyl-CoA hydratase/3-hydroxyacyl-CoA dehydrogenase
MLAYVKQSGFCHGCRGGLLFWADLIGAKHIEARLSQLAQEFGAAGVGGFFEPCEYLRKAAREGRKLSAGPAAAARM